MWMIVGMGNPGREYARTRHNVGFDVIDVLSEKLNIQVNRSLMHGLVGDGFFGGEKVMLVKPQTFMNLSGQCVSELVSFYKVPMDRLLLIYDDIDLPLGKLRLRLSGSAGTHNGMRSVVACVGSENFPRIRIGVGEAQRGELKDFVLGKPGKAALQTLDEVYQRAADAAQLIIAGRIGDAQARYNKKHEGL